MTPQDKYLDLIENYSIIIGTVCGYGANGQKYINEAHLKLKKFVQKYPIYKESFEKHYRSPVQNSDDGLSIASMPPKTFHLIHAIHSN